MAQGLPTPKSREQILSEMLTEYVGLTGVNDLNTGSVLTQFFDVVARSVARNSGDIFQILRDYSVDRATGEALNRIGSEERVYRRTTRTAAGTVKVTDTSFEKISTKVYAGAVSPNIGSKKILVSDASLFPSTGGRIYIGRGTPNIEGPLNYDSTENKETYWQINLSSPTTKFHNISESVILGQGNPAVRNISVGTSVVSPGSGAVADVIYTVSSSAILLDGENVNEYVQVVAQQPGTIGNAPAGAIREFQSPPFTGASVINVSPFTTGADSESDDDYRDRIKKGKLSKGLGTSLAVKNAVLGAKASDENAVVTSNEIDTTNPEETILYIDNGQGYEEKTKGIGVEFIVDSAVGGERSFQLATGGRQTSISKAFLVSSETSPFNIKPYDKLDILVGGIISEHIFSEGDFKSPGSATTYEIVASINNNTDLLFEATTSDSGTKVLIQAKTEDNEFLQLSTPTTGTDAGVVLGFSKNEVRTVLLYKNRELLDKNGRTAFVISKNQYEWDNSIVNGDTLIVAVDGTDPVTYTFTDQNFLSEGQHSSVSNQNSLSSWANVINNKITGITAEVNGERIKLTSNLGALNRASIIIDSSSTLVQKGMFSTSLGLTGQGNEADFELSRNTAQIKLKYPLAKGDSLRLGSQFTRAEIVSEKILGGQITVASDAYLWLIVDGPDAEPVSIGVTGNSFLTISKPGSGVVRYTSNISNAFSNVQVGDYVIVWSNELSEKNRLEGRVHAVSATYLDLKVTTAEQNLAVLEGPVIFSEGFTVIRTEHIPQKIKIPTGIYSISAVAAMLNEQLSDSTVGIDNDEIFVIRTNTESTDGSLFLADFNNSAKSLSFVKNSSAYSITSQLAFYESVNTDKQFPEFIHGKITADVYADPSDTFINSIQSSQNLSSLNVDPSGFICFSQPFDDVNDVSSSECVEIQNFSGSTINLENSSLYRRSRINDRFCVINGHDFGHEDSIIAILDNDPNQKTFNIPLYRTAITNPVRAANPDDFRAFDFDGGNVEFTDFFDPSFSFDNYKCLMQAKNIIDPGNPDGNITTTTTTEKDAILFRSVEWGRSGEKIGVGYFYPTVPDQSAISHTMDVGEEVNIKIFLKSGTKRSISADGTTEWNVTTLPLDSVTDLVTYSYSAGVLPGMADVHVGDYVTISSFGEFSPSNLGTYKVYAADSNSFIIKRAKNSAVIESNIANLQNNTIIFYQNTATTAKDIVDYVNAGLSSFITATLVNDLGIDGSGVIVDSTEENLGYTTSYVKLLDGKNYILTTNLGADVDPVVLPQFTFKSPINLDFFHTRSNYAYGFNNGENIRLVPVTTDQVSNFLNVLAVTGLTTLGEIKPVNRNSKLQISTNTIGGNGAVQIAGGLGNAAAAAVTGSCAAIGQQGNQSSIISVSAASAVGFHSDQWVKVFASVKQKKTTFIDDTNSIQVSYLGFYNSLTPEVVYSKIEIFDRSTEQRIFGRNRYHTRTRGRNFKVEKQGQFVCISWDENGTQPYFLKSAVPLKDSSSSTITIYNNLISNTVEVAVNTGNMRFDEVAIGDLITLSNRVNTENNGSFVVTGRSADGKMLRINNPNAVNELAVGSFTITDNSNMSTTTFTVGSTTLNSTSHFSVGATADETASNVAAAIGLVTNVSATSSGSIIHVSATVPSVSIATSVSGTGATASQTYLTAPISNTGDVLVKSEVQEGDSVNILSDFNILNRGVHRIIRKFNNSIYIDNSNAVEEEITLANQFISTGANSSTNYNITKMDGFCRLSWAGVGAEPALQNVRPGDTAILGTNFNISNRGEYHVIDSGEKLQEITKIVQSVASAITSGQYAYISNPAGIDSHYIWFNKDGIGGNPSPGGTGIEVVISSSDSATTVATKLANKINTSFGSIFTATATDNYVIIKTVGYGPTTDAHNVNVAGDFKIELIQQGRLNYVDYINVNGVSETGVVVTDVLQFHREAMKFKEYEGTVPGDVFVITNNFLGNSNKKSFVITDILSESKIIAKGTSVSTDKVLLDSNFNKIYIEEENAYVGYKKISLVITNPSNLNTKNIVFDTAGQFEKIGEIGGVSLSAMSKLEFPTTINKGIDAYKYNTGLIAEANRIVYGDPRDNTTYPGVAAAGAEIFIKAPLVKRIQVSVNIRIKTGIPFTTIIEEVRNSVASLINSNPVGQSIPISNIVTTVGGIVGVQAVAISSPQYDALNDIVRVNAGEKSLVLDIVSDITVSKIE